MFSKYLRSKSKRSQVSERMKIRVFQENPAKIYSEKHPGEHEKRSNFGESFGEFTHPKKKMLGNIVV